MGDERVVSREVPAVETNEKRIEDVEAENRRRMRLSRQLATMDNIVAGRPAKLSKEHFSRKFQGKVHLNFWLSGSPQSPYFHPKKLPIPPKVYLLKVQGTKSKARIDFHCPL